jgi:branched-chain amino acid transport system permease protein
VIDQILVGAAIGCLYSLVAQGFTLTFRTTRTMNFAVGEFAAVGAFVALALAGVGWLPTPAKLGIAALAVAFIGAVAYRFLILPFVSNDGHDPRWLLVTVALSILMVDLLRNSQGTKHRPLGFADIDGQLSLGIGKLPAQLALIALVSVVTIVIVALVVTRTGLGMRMRAVAQDSETAELVGIDARMTGMISYAIGSGTIVLGVTLWTGYVGVCLPRHGPAVARVGLRGRRHRWPHVRLGRPGRRHHLRRRQSAGHDLVRLDHRWPDRPARGRRHLGRSSRGPVLQIY